jgi:hypothetical protein
MGYPYATTKISHPGSLKMPDVYLAGVRVPVLPQRPQGKAGQGARTGNLKSVTTRISPPPLVGLQFSIFPQL